jgi:hypothetical protein
MSSNVNDSTFSKSGKYNLDAHQALRVTQIHPSDVLAPSKSQEGKFEKTFSPEGTGKTNLTQTHSESPPSGGWCSREPENLKKICPIPDEEDQEEEEEIDGDAQEKIVADIFEWTDMLKGNEKKIVYFLKNKIPEALKNLGVNAENIRSFAKFDSMEVQEETLAQIVNCIARGHAHLINWEKERLFYKGKFNLMKTDFTSQKVIVSQETLLQQKTLFKMKH